jgi:tetratricopeptide (TPR) repeat protein
LEQTVARIHCGRRTVWRACLLLLLAWGTSQGQRPGGNPEAVRLAREAAELDRRGDVEGAVAAYRRAIALSPSDGLLYFNLGRILADADRLPEAAAAYGQAVALLEKQDKGPAAFHLSSAMNNLALVCYRSAASQGFQRGRGPAPITDTYRLRCAP